MENYNMCLEIVCCTDTGLARTHNEDYISIDKSLGLAIVADGMGGYQAGEVASEIAVKTIMEQLKSIKTQPRLMRYANHRYHSATVLLEQAIIKANQVIYDTAAEKTCYLGMGTTVVAVLFHDDFMSIAHVGDSRLYRLRGTKFCQLTKDHSVRQELIDCGFYTPEQARHSHNRNLVTRALGVGQEVSVEIQESNLLAQDIYLLCSDGLNDMLDDSEMQDIINNANTLEQAGQNLIDAANNKGGKDNISLILVRLLQVTSHSQKGRLRRLFGL